MDTNQNQISEGRQESKISKISPETYRNCPIDRSMEVLPNKQSDIILIACSSLWELTQIHSDKMHDWYYAKSIIQMGLLIQAMWDNTSKTMKMVTIDSLLNKNTYWQKMINHCDSQKMVILHPKVNITVVLETGMRLGEK